MSYVIECEIPGLPKTANTSRRGGHDHWAIRAKEAKTWKLAVLFAVTGKRPVAPLKRAVLTLTRCSAVAPDSDGLVSSFKHVLDGLVDAGVLENDRMANIGMPEYRWERAKPGKGFIRIKVQELEAKTQTTSKQQKGKIT